VIEVGEKLEVFLCAFLETVDAFHILYDRYNSYRQ
jgi:hypothetical protein